MWSCTTIKGADKPNRVYEITRHETTQGLRLGLYDGCTRALSFSELSQKHAVSRCSARWLRTFYSVTSYHARRNSRG